MTERDKKTPTSEASAPGVNDRRSGSDAGGKGIRALAREREGKERFVKLRCGVCRAYPVTETNHARGGQSWHCPRCQRQINPLDRRCHARKP